MSDHVRIGPNAAAADVTAPRLRPMTARSFLIALIAAQAVLYLEPRAALILFLASGLALIPGLRPIGTVDARRLWPVVIAALAVDVAAMAGGVVAWRFPLQGDANIFIFLKSLGWLPILSLYARAPFRHLMPPVGLVLLFTALGTSVTSRLALGVFLVVLTLGRAVSPGAARACFLALFAAAASFPLWFPAFDATFHALRLDVLDPGKFLARVLIWRDAHAILVPFDLAVSIARDVTVVGVLEPFVIERFAHPHNFAFEGARRVGFVPYGLFASGLWIVLALRWRGSVAEAITPALAALVVALSVDYSVLHAWPVAFVAYAVAVVRLSRA